MCVLFFILTFLLGFIIPIIFYLVVMKPIIKEMNFDYKEFINLQSENQDLKHKIYVLKNEIKHYNKKG